ncbi:MAG: hypothetical protein GPOALKHO_000329 [Sodalis sp.]|nr:MAG: hypothetical protein GPOALKHO_000329 [Sodalis sp.]
MITRFAPVLTTIDQPYGLKGVQYAVYLLA